MQTTDPGIPPTTKPEFDFTLLLEAINSAIMEAHRNTEEHQVAQLRKYFAEDGTAVTQAVHVKGEDGTATVQVPLLSLLPPAAIRMKEVSLHLKVPVIRLAPKAGSETGKTNVAAVRDASETDYLADLHICYEGIAAPATFERISELLTRSIR